MEYYIARKGPTSFTVAKFDGGAEPLEVYKVDYSAAATPRPLSRCTCMAWRSRKTRPCKHVEMVAAFISQGEPVGQAFSDPRRV